MLLEVDLKGTRRVINVPDAHRQLPLSTVLRRAGIALNTRCGERGLCESCIVRPSQGSLSNLASGATVDARFAADIRACQHRLNGDAHCRIEIPDRSLLHQRASVVTEFHAPTLASFDPIWRTDADFDGATWLPAKRSRVPARPLGVAIDIGTTTVVVLLVDLKDGTILSRSSDFNQQMRLGDDVLTRITLASDPASLIEMRRAIVEDTLVPLILSAVQIAEASPGDVVCGTVAGNTTMLHLLMGVDPTPMGVVPFTPAFINHRIAWGDPLADLGRSSGLDLQLHLLPGCSAYVGADISSGMIATPLLASPPPSLLLDVGTNGEMVLRLDQDRLFGCATAAGPAFEGSGLTCGTRAVDGAITHINISLNPLDLKLRQIGTGKPIGLCGSFYIDFLAQGRRAGLLDPGGRYVDQVVKDHPDRFVPTECSGRAMKVARGIGGIDLIVSEGDIAKLLAAKAAIAAGLKTMMCEAGIVAADIQRLYLAGGFGLHLDRNSAIACGMLPDFTEHQISVVGNSSLAGAWMCLCSADALKNAITVSRNVTILELNRHESFEDFYIDMLALPE